MVKPHVSIKKNCFSSDDLLETAILNLNKTLCPVRAGAGSQKNFAEESRGEPSPTSGLG